MLPTEAKAAEIVESGTCGDNLTWTLDSEGLLTISGTGPMWDYIDGTPWRFDSTIKSVVIADGVTSIYQAAFFQCENLTGVTIPDSITSIDDSAFSCCNRLTNITIPDSVTSIGNYEFHNCDVLSNVIIGDNVTNIGDSAFYSCDMLRHVLYTGTEAQWNSISIGEDNDSLLNATRHYNCTGNEIRRGVCTMCNPVALGDADGDEFIDAFDASLVMKFSVGAISADELNVSVLDVDGDGFVDAFDASLIQKYSVGVIDKFTIDE